jgi:K(+)-stimulated pyrophosphate-energized sodium pump
MLNKIFSLKKVAALFVFIIATVSRSFANEANLIIPDLTSVEFLGNAIDGKTLLMSGFFICIFGLFFGLYHFMGIKNLPVHKPIKSILELIYETCKTYKTYLITQGKFIFVLEVLLAAIIVLYFGLLQHFGAVKVATIVLCSVTGILGSCAVA